MLLSRVADIQVCSTVDVLAYLEIRNFVRFSEIVNSTGEVTATMGTLSLGFTAMDVDIGQEDDGMHDDMGETGECGSDACGCSQEAADAPEAAPVAEAQEDDSRTQRRPRSSCTLLITTIEGFEAGAPDAQWSEAKGQQDLQGARGAIR